MKTCSALLLTLIATTAAVPPPSDATRAAMPAPALNAPKGDARIARPSDAVLKMAMRQPLNLSYERYSDWTVTPMVSGGMTKDWVCTSGPMHPNGVPDNYPSQSVSCTGTPTAKSVQLQVQVTGTGPNAGKQSLVSGSLWSGDCGKTTGDSCALSMDAPRTVSFSLGVPSRRPS